MPQPSVVAEPIRRPRLVEAAFALALVAGLVAVAFAAVLPFQIPRVLETQRTAAANRGASLAELEQQLVIGVVITCVIAALYTAAVVWAAVRFRAGRRKGRFWTVILTVLALVPILLTPATLLTVVLLVVADGLLFLPSVSAWFEQREKAFSRARLAGPLRL